MSVVPRQGDGKVTVPELLQRKSSAADSPSQKIVCLTAYDYPTSRLADEAGVDVILVGDSLGMVVLGYDSTLPVTLDEMLHHTRAVRRGTRRALVVADMPYGSYHAGTDESLRNAVRFVKEAGAEVVIAAGGVVMALLAHADIHEAAGMPILNGIINLVKLGEMAAKTNRLMGGRFTSKYRSYAPPPADQITEFRKHYGADIYPTVKAP